jgi:NADPH:quinone reductase-like Zn-dependent oxidoreductase
MHAITISSYGATPEPTELPVPRPGPGEVLVGMSAAGLNPYDWKIIDGAVRDARFPLVIGVDGAGTVEQVGPGVSRFRPGDPVFGQFSMVARGGGSYAEKAVAKEAALATAPRTIALSEAAALPTAGTTALNLVDLVAGARSLLVVGATGGVGTFVTQLARARGIEVIATASEDRAQLMRALGAARIVDHTRGAPLADQVRAARPDGVDALIQLVGDADALRDLVPVVRPGGTVLSSVFAVPSGGLPGVNAVNFQNTGGAELLERLADEIDSGHARVVVGTTVTLAQAPEALERSRHGRADGKTIIVI